VFLELDWWSTWPEEFEGWLDRRFDARVLNTLRENASPKWLQWLDTAQAELDGQQCSSVELFVPVLRERYQGLKVYHATRLKDLASVRLHGLRAWSAEELRRLAKEAFFASANPSTLELALDQADPNHRAGRVYSYASLGHALGTLDGSATGRIPCFSQDGSEYINHVGLRLGAQDGAAGDRRGRGYLLACLVDWECLGPIRVREFAELVLGALIVDRFFDACRYNLLGHVKCVSVLGGIPPAAISHYAETDSLIGRSDLAPTDLAWKPLHGTAERSVKHPKKSKPQ